MHSLWKPNQIGIEINYELGYSAVEIDESKILSSGNLIYWMFGLIDRNTKEARIRCVLNDRTKEKLLPIIKEYVHTNIDDVDLEQNENADDYGNRINPEDYTIKTRIFSDSFRTYQVSDFKTMG